MRLLFYNWVDDRDPLGRGGGVAGYQNRLLAELAERPDIDCTVLSSGQTFDLRNRPPRWRPSAMRDSGDRVRRFEIVNSACLSPSHHSFGHPAQVSDPATEAVFAAFVEQQGPFDAIHFNSLEGLPAAVLDLRRKLLQTRFVLALHNYYPFCPQVNLWHRERSHCADFAGGSRCPDCLPFRPNLRLVRLAQALNHGLQRSGIGPGTAAYDHAARPGMRAGAQAVRRLASARRQASAAEQAPAPPSPESARAFSERRARMVDLINRNCDRILCVSNRVAELAAAHGLDERRLATSYIGSDHASQYARTTPKPGLLRPDGTARMAYLGYMRRDKGFYFLLDALEALPDHHAARLHLVFAAAGRDAAVLTAFERLRPRFASLTWHDGFVREDLDGLLADVDFGIVPPLWEDNLPQVAIEMHARRIPLLTSDRGGARELAHHAPMVFQAGDAGDLHARLGDILSGRIDTAAYWAGAMAPVSMATHVDALLEHYRASG